MTNRQKWRIYFTFILACYVIYFVEHYLIASENNCMISERESKRRDLLHDTELQPFYQHLTRRSREKWRKGEDYKMDMYRDPRWRSRKPRLKILLLSYRNSGSTYVGDVLRQNHEIFYVYHPIITLQDYITEYRGELMYLYRKMEALRRKDLRAERMFNLTTNNNSTTSIKQLSQRTITHFLNCNFTELDFASLSNLPYFHGVQTREFSDCIRGGSLVVFIKCFHLLFKACNKTEVTLVNTAQLPVKTAESLLLNNADLKVIYLYRDPRATLWSQFNSGVFRWASVHSKAKTFCDLLSRDLKAVQNISSLYLDRFMSVRYETMMENHKGTFKSMHAFLGLEYPDVDNYTSNNNTMCTDCVRSDRDAWRSSIPYEGAGIIDMYCARAYQEMGYKRISDQATLRNLNYSLEAESNIV